MDADQQFYAGDQTLVWEAAKEPTIINHGYGQRAMEAIEKTFGPYPITLTKDDLRILRAMDAAGGWRPIGDLLELLEREGSIRIWLVPGYQPTLKDILATAPVLTR